MASEKDVQVHARELPSSSSSQWPLQRDAERAEPLPQWPTEPQALKQSPLSYWVGLIFDVALILAPLLLIMKTALVIYAYSLDKNKSGLPGDPVSPLTLKIMEFNSQLVTLFTIIFITTVATLVKRYALYKAQVGASVTQLEQYQASISLPSTLKMIVLLRAWNWASLLLVFVWSWYYLGSQAAQREYTYALSNPAVDTRIVFENPEGPSYFDDIATITSVTQRQIDANWIGSSSTMSGQDGHDEAGAMIAPFLIQPAGVSVVTAEKGGWLKIGDGSTVGERYSSSLGSYIFHATTQFASSRWLGKYTAATSYFYANCSDPKVGNTTAFPSGVLPTMTTSINSTNVTSDGFPVVDVWLRNTENTIHSTCNLGRQYIDLRVECDGKDCAMYQFRPDPTKPVMQPATYFADTNRTNYFFNALLMASGIPDDFATETYVDSNIGLTRKDDNTWDSTYSGTTMPLGLSQGLSLLMNGYYTASQPDQNAFAFASLSFDTMMGLINGTVSDPTWQAGAAHGAIYFTHYQLSLPWIIVDFATCAILLMCAAFSFRLRKVTIAPDVFGYVSSMTRDNPNLRLPEGGSAMSGVDRARALKNVKVKLTDLNADGTATGRIGLTRVDDTVRDHRLSRTKQYL